MLFQLAEKISKQDEEREEMERIRMELHLEEQEEKERMKERVRLQFSVISQYSNICLLVTYLMKKKKHQLSAN